MALFFEQAAPDFQGSKSVKFIAKTKLKNNLCNFSPQLDISADTTKGKALYIAEGGVA